MKLDMDSNTICGIDGYRTKVLEYLPQIQVLDGKDLDGNSIYTEDEEEEAEYGEEGEIDIDDQYNKILHMLTPEQR